MMTLKNVAIGLYVVAMMVALVAVWTFVDPDIIGPTIGIGHR